MKKFISVLLAFMFTFVFMTGCGAAEQTSDETTKEEVKKFELSMQIGNPVMTVNGENKNIDENGTAPVVENDRTLVPIRAIIEAMGGSVSWDGETNTAVLTIGEDSVTLVIGSEKAMFNGEEKTLDVAPQIINDRTMLPIRFIAESFKFNVDWNEATETITITKDIAANDASAKEDAAKDDTEKTDGGKALVVYYSATGSTQKVANYIKDAANADIFELVPVNEYTSDDLDWTDKSSRVNEEHDDESKRDVELENTTVPDFDQYDTVYIGYPIWWGIAAWPVDNFVKNNDFTDKTVIPFCTSASSGMGESGKLLADMAGSGDWKDGMRFRSGASESDVKAWVESLN